MKIYLEISITADGDEQELIIPTMMELGCSRFQETGRALCCYLEKSAWNGEKQSRLTTEVLRMLRREPSAPGIALREIEEEDWNAQWEQSLEPVEVGRRLAVKPSWATYENREGRIVLEINPKMSFGTGYHETTRLMLRLMEDHLRSGARVLDVGTGTGILAIAAVKLGAASALGIDNDEWSIDNARENVLSNRVGTAVTISPTPVEELSETGFDLVAANLTLNTNIALLHSFRRLLRGDGVLLISGFFRNDLDRVLHHLRAERFQLMDSPAENEWLAMAARRQA